MTRIERQARRGPRDLRFGLESPRQHRHRRPTTSTVERRHHRGQAVARAARPVGRHVAAPQAQPSRARRPVHHHRLPHRRHGRDRLLPGHWHVRASAEADARSRLAPGYLAPYAQRGQLRAVAHAASGRRRPGRTCSARTLSAATCFSRVLVATRIRHARRRHRRRHRPHHRPLLGPISGLLRRLRSTRSSCAPPTSSSPSPTSCSCCSS